MPDQPNDGMQHEFGRMTFSSPSFDLERCLPRFEAGAIDDAENVGVDRHGVFAMALLRRHWPSGRPCARKAIRFRLE